MSNGGMYNDSSNADGFTFNIYAYSSHSKKKLCKISITYLISSEKHNKNKGISIKIRMEIEVFFLRMNFN